MTETPDWIKRDRKTIAALPDGPWCAPGGFSDKARTRWPEALDKYEALQAENERLRGLLTTCFRVTVYGHVHENLRSLETDELIRSALANT